MGCAQTLAKIDCAIFGIVLELEKALSILRRTTTDPLLKAERKPESLSLGAVES